MLSMMATLQPSSVWKMWTEHIMRNKENCFQKACIVEHAGRVCSAVKSFHPTTKEIKVINNIFLEKLNNNIATDRISINEKTYMIKTLSSAQIIAFSGCKYVIVNRTKTKHVIAICDSKSKYGDAALWLSKLCKKMIDKGF